MAGGISSYSYHNGTSFSTTDQDRDKASGSCAWWYNHCHKAIPTSPHGEEKKDNSCNKLGILWEGITAPEDTWEDLQTIEMIRSIDLKMNLSNRLR